MLENGTQVSKCDEGMEFLLGDGKLKLLILVSCLIGLHQGIFVLLINRF